MDRRSFLRRAALVAAGAVAGDQLEVLDRLTHRRRVFPGADFGRSRTRLDLGHPAYTQIARVGIPAEGLALGDTVRLDGLGLGDRVFTVARIDRRTGLAVAEWRRDIRESPLFD